MSTNQDDYGMDIEQEMKLKAYSSYIKSQGLDPLEHHSDAVSYLEGDSDSKPLEWDSAMELLKGAVEQEQNPADELSLPYRHYTD